VGSSRTYVAAGAAVERVTPERQRRAGKGELLDVVGDEIVRGIDLVGAREPWGAEKTFEVEQHDRGLDVRESRDDLAAYEDADRAAGGGADVGRNRVRGIALG
jgi:hypothetical protein